MIYSKLMVHDRQTDRQMTFTLISLERDSLTLAPIRSVPWNGPTITVQVLEQINLINLATITNQSGCEAQDCV